MPRKLIPVTRPITTTYGEGTRVTALVDRVPVWFECENQVLSEVSEVFGCAMMIPSLQQGRQLALDGAVSPQWLDNMPQITAMTGGWWGFPQLPPLATRRESDLQPRHDGAMLCFSSGVDSYHTLLCSGEKFTQLITAHGYDIRLDNPHRWQHLESAVKRAASDAGIPLSVVRTNLRQHPLYKDTSWQRSHGGALASLAHLMRNHGDHLLISSSFTRDRDQPWGTHWDLDHLWSSEAMGVRHFGEHCSRIVKIHAIAHEPIVRRNLHVCFKVRSDNGHGNCSQCEKCVRTMVILDQCGALGQFTVFSQRKPLPELIDALPGITPAIQVFWHDILAAGVSSDIKASIDRMLLRSPRTRGPLRRLSKRIRMAMRRAWASLS